MAASMKERLNDLWYEFKYGNYDFIEDLQQLTALQLKEKYKPLMNDPLFFKRHIVKNKSLLHQYLTDTDKALFLDALGYSLLDLNKDNETPIHFIIKNQKNLGANLLDSVYALYRQAFRSGKQLVIYEEDLDELFTLAQQNKHSFLSVLKSVYGRSLPGDKDNNENITPSPSISSLTEASLSYSDGGVLNYMNMNEDDFMKLSLIGDMRGEGNEYSSKERNKPDNNAYKSLLNQATTRARTQSEVGKNTVAAVTNSGDKKLKQANVLLSNQQENRSPKIHGAISSKNKTLIAKFILEGANPFAANAQGWNAFEYCMRQGYQEEFNHLIDSTYTSPLLGTLQLLPDLKKGSGHPMVSAVQLLNFITNYLQTKGDYDHHLLSFIWKYLVAPVYDNYTREEQLTLAYFFKNVHVLLSFSDSQNERVKMAATQKGDDALSVQRQAHASTSSIDSEETKQLLIEVKHLLKLSEEKTMLALNTCRHWRGLGGGFGQSTLNAKLQEIVAIAQVAFGNVPGKPLLSEKLEEILVSGTSSIKQAHLTAFKRLVLEIKHVSNERSEKYQAKNYVERISRLRITG